MSIPNPYCQVLRIPVPRLERAMESSDANYYALLLVVLLEHGEPVTLEQAARRFEEAGVAPFERALASLKRCKPGRAPIYRNGDLYALDPHDHEADLWAFRLGLRAASVPLELKIVRPDPRPLADPDQPITPAELDEAWGDRTPWAASYQRIVVSLLDAHGGSMRPEECRALIQARGLHHFPLDDKAQFLRRGMPVRVAEDGRWVLDRAHPAVLSARRAIRDRIAELRRWEANRPDPAVTKALSLQAERKREEHAAELAALRRVIVHAFPATRPEALVLVDVARRELTTYLGDELPDAIARLAEYDFILAVQVRGLVQSLDFDPGTRHLGELSPPQKTITIDRRGRTLRITIEMLARSSCGISRPFGDPKVLLGYLRSGELTKFRRRLESDAKSLFALYQYGRLHGAWRLRWGFLDEMLPVPWVHWDETKLYSLMERSRASGTLLEVVVGSAPGWSDPWARAQPVMVMKDDSSWRSWLVGAGGYPIEQEDVQLARLAGSEGEGM